MKSSLLAIPEEAKTTDEMDIDLKAEDIKQEDSELSPINLPPSQVSASSPSSSNPYSGLDSDELTNAVYGQKRGRRVGSGANQKRKAEGDYSENANTKKARLRKTNMTPAQLELERAKDRERQALSRKVKALQNNQSFLLMTLKDQDRYIKEFTAKVKKIQATEPDSSSTIRRYMMDALELHMASKFEKEAFDKKFVQEVSHLGFDPDHDIYWGDDDEDENDDDEAPRCKQRKKIPKKELAAAEFGERLDLDRVPKEDKDKVLDQLMDLKDLKGVDKEMFDKICKKVEEKQHGLALQRVNQAIFYAYRDDLIDRAAVLNNAVLAMEQLCVNGKPKDPSSKATDALVTPRLRAFVVALAHVQSEKPQKRSLLSNFKAGEGIKDARGGFRQATPEEMNETGWYDLPGPSGLWPDSKLWYEKNGLEVDPKHTASVMKAVAVMKCGIWTEGWVKAMIRGDALNRDLSIRWDEVS